MHYYAKVLDHAKNTRKTEVITVINKHNATVNFLHIYAFKEKKTETTALSIIFENVPKALILRMSVFRINYTQFFFHFSCRTLNNSSTFYGLLLVQIIPNMLNNIQTGTLRCRFLY